MGVKGLLPTLQSITKCVSLSSYRGLTVAVDAMSWLHKGVFACDVKALAKHQRSDDNYNDVANNQASYIELKCIQYTINKAEILQAKFGIQVILVIDGDSLPSKKEENISRREERDKAFAKGIAAEKASDSRAARRFYAQSCSVTHKMKYMLITACKQLGINFIVAPYEADAQLGRLAHTGVVDLVITEDSDILVYGAPRILFKVDWDTFQGKEIQLMKDLGDNVSPSFRNWTHDMFVFMCIVSGCDYCSGVPGIGIKLAHKLVRIHRTPSKIFSALRAAGRMPRDFEEKFWVAFRTFRHQRVFCPSKQQIETLWPIAGSNHDASPNKMWPFLGEYIDGHIASKIADGTLHPTKKVPWSEALRQPEHRTQSFTTSQQAATNGIKIHRRSSSHDITNGSNCRGAKTDKTNNVWHQLIYGSRDSSSSNANAPRSSNNQEAGKENEHDNDNAPSKLDMFGFFPQKKKKGKDDNAGLTKNNKAAVSSGQTIRPPLREIFVGNESASSSSQQPKSKSKSNYVTPAHHRDIPIHFNEYASRLVGRAFKPISRKRKKEDHSRGTNSSKYVQKIWEKCAKVQQPTAIAALENQLSILEKENAVYEKEKKEEDEGVSRFQKKDNSNVNTIDYDYEHAASQDYFHAHSIHHTTHHFGEETLTTTHQQQYDALPNLTSYDEQCDTARDTHQYSSGYDHSSQELFSTHTNADLSTALEEENIYKPSQHHEENIYQSNHQAAHNFYAIHEDLPQCFEDSQCLAFQDDPIDQQYSYQTNPDQYDDVDQYGMAHDMEGCSEHNPFQQLRTTIKKKPCNLYENHVDSVDHDTELSLHQDYNIFNDDVTDTFHYETSQQDYHYEAANDSEVYYNPFTQLPKTVMKRAA